MRPFIERFWRGSRGCAAVTRKPAVVIVGFGHVARNSWLPVLRKYGCHVSAVDPSEQAREEARQRGVSASPRLLPSAGAAYALILTPSPGHGPDALQALRLGYDVLVEKPVCATIDEWKRLVTAAANTGRVLLGSPFTYDGYAAELVGSLIKQGVMGCLERICIEVIKPGPLRSDGSVVSSRRWFLDENAGPARDFAPYPLALIFGIFGQISVPRWVSEDASRLVELTGTVEGRPITGRFGYSLEGSEEVPVRIELASGMLALDSERVDRPPIVRPRTHRPAEPESERSKYELALSNLLAARPDTPAVQRNHHIVEGVTAVLQELGAR
jgi:predicted dehydrogenase